MGQKHSHMPLGDAINHPTQLWPSDVKKAVYVNLTLPHPAKGQRAWTLVATTRHKCWLYPSDGAVPEDLTTSNLTIAATHAWEPRSTMLDEEYSNGYQLARGQGVGPILIDCLRLACYPRWDRTRGLVLQTSEWFHSSEAENVLRGDLGLGYDVLILAGANAEHRYRLKDSATDKAPTRGQKWIHEDQDEDHGSSDEESDVEEQECSDEGRSDSSDEAQRPNVNEVATHPVKLVLAGGGSQIHENDHDKIEAQLRKELGSPELKLTLIVRCCDVCPRTSESEPGFALTGVQCNGCHTQYDCCKGEHPNAECVCIKCGSHNVSLPPS